MAGTITSANASFQISVANLFDTPITLQNWTADRAWETDAVDIAELQLSVDGFLSAGYIPYLIPQSVMFMPSSPSIPLFEQWIATESSNQEKLIATGILSIPSVGTKYNFTQGYLVNITPTPSAAKVLGSRTFRLTWAAVSGAPI